MVYTFVLNPITLSNKDRDKPFLAASSDFTVASSYLWSPAITSFFANLNGIQQAGSIDWAHSSMTSKSNIESWSLVSTNLLSVLSHAEVRVQQITFALNFDLDYELLILRR